MDLFFHFGFIQTYPNFPIPPLDKSTAFLEQMDPGDVLMSEISSSSRKNAQHILRPNKWLHQDKNFYFKVSPLIKVEHRRAHVYSK